MGIRGLSSWIRWAAPSTIQLPDWEALRGKRIGIDILGFLYKAKAQRIGILVYLSQLMVRCRQYNILPIPIFDGKPPDEKRPMIDQRAERRNTAATKYAKLKQDASTVVLTAPRKEVIEQELQKLESAANYLTSEERDLAKQFFYSCGVMSYNATGEADNILAYFARRGMIDAVISNDFDLLARGVQLLLVPDMYALPGDTSGWKQYSLQTILDEVKFSYDQFAEMCVLMGCDYLVGEFVLPYKSAYWAIKYRGDMTLTLRSYNIRPEKYLKAKEILTGTNETAEGLMGQKQWEKWSTGSPRVEPDALQVWSKSFLSHLTQQDLQLLMQG